ncbi:hypothetical protein PG984_016239 [Apiospora sp. TS-2023a]
MEKKLSRLWQWARLLRRGDVARRAHVGGWHGLGRYGGFDDVLPDDLGLKLLLELQNARLVGFAHAKSVKGLLQRVLSGGLTFKSCGPVGRDPVAARPDIFCCFSGNP